MKEKGFTLAAISLPIFISQLEKPRRAVNVNNYVAVIVTQDDVYYSGSAGFDNMHVHAKSTIMVS